MRKLNIFRTPQDFLNSSLSYLEIKEAENNLIIGLINNIENKTKEYKECTFVSVTEDEKIKAVSISTSPRVIIAGDHTDDEAIEMICGYYKSLDRRTGGVMGEKSISQKYADATKYTQVKKREMIVHELLRTNPVRVAKGTFEKAVTYETDIITDMRISFDKETFGYTRLDLNEIKLDTGSKIRKDRMYCWKSEGKIVSIACIMRETRNTGVIGLVYTPDKFRKNGYATGIVHSLSNLILKSGLSKCVLFTDSANPVSNSIYKKIGYEAIAEFADIYFNY